MFLDCKITGLETDDARDKDLPELRDVPNTTNFNLLHFSAFMWVYVNRVVIFNTEVTNQNKI